ncbi:ABC transporter permease subunit [Alphaproteobacteria bacterium]|nr:ABC transporter permease subunit [Alphaproteobacteria bacterium]
MSSRAQAISLRIGSIFVLLILWWIVALLMADPEILPGPVLIGNTIAYNLVVDGPEGKSAYFHVGITLGRTFLTFGAAMLLGIAIGLTMGLRRVIEHSLMALLPLMLTMPTILMVFLAVLWFGFTEIGSLIAVVGVVTPFVAVNIFQGAKAMDKSLIDMAKTFRADKGMMIRKVYLPQLLPYIFSAFRFAFGMTWKIVALAETFGIKFGIGYMFFFWFEQFSMEQVLAWIIMFVILMLILEHGVFARIEHRAFKWRPASSLQT